MNQILAAAVLFGIVSVVFIPLIAESGSQIFSRSASISDVMDSSRQQAGQILVATHIQQDHSGITIYLSNIGLEDVRIHAVLVDGVDSAYVLSQDSMDTGTLSAGELGVLEIKGHGNSVQIISETGKLFELTVPGI